MVNINNIFFKTYYDQGFTSYGSKFPERVRELEFNIWNYLGHSILNGVTRITLVREKEAPYSLVTQKYARIGPGDLSEEWIW